ncbi:hypothetical protein [Defluviitalea phaphyphila]|uniref:hypothetical protein n=1 Tax=Defluviitalea phaphyphila TaxID=1473580 RepID=UPI0007319353|nr:hypothetical protein [Defluviitalea phaphyphila]
MRKRKLRILETIIGIIGSLFGIGIFFFVGMLLALGDFYNTGSSLLDQYSQQLSSLIIYSIIGIILSFLINFKRKFAGWGLIIISLAITVQSVDFAGFIPGFFFFVAGIITLLRK